MQRSQTPRGAFDAASAGESLQKLFQAELDAVHRAGNAQGTKPELYKAAQPPAGPWGAATAGRAVPKAGAMANGQDFLAALNTSLKGVATPKAK
ncbi:hypothetical protein JCM10908_003794 [Rhodotorula pacifica]|uniref:uncharacterized protein n=1 Tax=Rhodotorula pacifica TaxID=1495444 RepID=UPI00317E4C09